MRCDDCLRTLSKNDAIDVRFDGGFFVSRLGVEFSLDDFVKLCRELRRDWGGEFGVVRVPGFVFDRLWTVVRDHAVGHSFRYGESYSDCCRVEDRYREYIRSGRVFVDGFWVERDEI